MPPNPFVLVAPGATRGLGLALTRQFLRTTNLPVYATHRSPALDKEVQDHILKPLSGIDPSRLNLLSLDLTSEDSIASAANSLSESLQKKGLNDAFIHTAFITAGILHPDQPHFSFAYHKAFLALPPQTTTRGLVTTSCKMGPCLGALPRQHSIKW